MFSVFPELLYLTPLAAFLLRLTLGCSFMFVAWQRIRSKKSTIRVLGIADGTIALMLFLGVYTQAAALAALLCTGFWLTVKDLRPLPRSTIILLAAISMAVVIMGAGLWKVSLFGYTWPLSFDLPL